MKEIPHSLTNSGISDLIYPPTMPDVLSQGRFDPTTSGDVV